MSFVKKYGLLRFIYVAHTCACPSIYRLGKLTAC